MAGGIRTGFNVGSKTGIYIVAFFLKVLNDFSAHEWFIFEKWVGCLKERPHYVLISTYPIVK